MRAVAPLMFVLAVACGGAPEESIPTDAPAPDALCGAQLRTSSCGPSENTGCGAGEKCTWIWIDTALSCGVVACVPDGDVPLDGECEFGPDGETTGFDNCAAGAICAGAVCRTLCTLSPDSCTDGAECTDYPGLFDGFTPELGACEPPP